MIKLSLIKSIIRQVAALNRRFHRPVFKNCLFCLAALHEWLVLMELKEAFLMEELAEVEDYDALNSGGWAPAA